VAPQGDVLCAAAPFATWSGNLVTLHERIMRAFPAIGVSHPSDLTVIGYSLGASLAQSLVRRWPGRYTRLVLIAAPSAPSLYGLKGLRSTVMMSGSRDRKDLMRAGVARARRIGIPSTFIELPGAIHGQMGSEPERTMGKALAWLFDHELE
jgi:pimeloyl-ACP methyl ester carboxylesterase